MPFTERAAAVSDEADGHAALAAQREGHGHASGGDAGDAQRGRRGQDAVREVADAGSQQFDAVAEMVRAALGLSELSDEMRGGLRRFQTGTMGGDDPPPAAAPITEPS